jgi:hypothetical protein
MAGTEEGRGEKMSPRAVNSPLTTKAAEKMSHASLLSTAQCIEGLIRLIRRNPVPATSSKSSRDLDNSSLLQVSVWWPGAGLIDPAGPPLFQTAFEACRCVNSPARTGDPLNCTGKDVPAPAFNDPVSVMVPAQLWVTRLYSNPPEVIWEADGGRDAMVFRGGV